MPQYGGAGTISSVMCGSNEKCSLRSVDYLEESGHLDRNAAVQFLKCINASSTTNLIHLLCVGLEAEICAVIRPEVRGHVVWGFHHYHFL